MDVFNLKSFVLFLSVFGCCAGQDLLPHDGPLDGVVGKNVTIKPDLEPGETFLTMAWTFNGGDELVPIVTLVSGGGGVENIAEDYKGRVFINKTNGILTLGPLKTTDNGDYAVQMVNKKGETQTGETKLQVLVPVSDVAIKSSVTEAVELNSTVVLTCSATGSFITFAWNNGTTPIVADGKKLTLTTVPLGSSSTLTVKDPLRTDLVGPIYCSATNKLGSEKSAPFNLSVSYGPEMVVLAATPAIPASMVLRMDGKLALSCTTQSSPPATVAWHHNGAALAKETAASLVLEKLTEAHSGNYSCVANNAKTLRSVSSKVIQFTVMQAVSGTTLTGPTETLLAGKQTANLSCQATAGKATTQAWFKDGKPLSPGDRVSVLADKVSIKPVQKGDNGEYRCDLTNAVNTDSATYKMVVNYGPEAAAVEAEEAVEINDVVKLTCAAMSMPAATYTWKFNGTKTAVTTAEYLIEKAVYKNTGMYTCEAHNAVTGLSVSAMHKLSVKEEGALDEGLSDGAIAGIVIAVLIVLAAAIAGAVYFQRQRTRPYEAASQAP